MKNRRSLLLSLGLALAGLLLLAGVIVAASPDPGTRAEPAGASGVTAGTAWGSGWQSIDPGETITLAHGLGGNADNYAVQLWFEDTNGEFGLNTRAYGGLEVKGRTFGAAWQGLTNNTIQVMRYEHDTLADRVRVWLWVPDPLPEYCSEWRGISPGTNEVFTHNLGGDVDDYVVGLWFRQVLAPIGQMAPGVNQRAYGGMEVGGDYSGAYWHNLDASTVSVYRFTQDPYAPEVRVCVSLADLPAFDSGWLDIALGETKTIDHDLGGDPNRYVVRTEFKDGTSLNTPQGGLGINHYAAGGMAEGDQYVGVNWENLTNSSIDVFRRPNDGYADQVRVRIWLPKSRVYLPIVLLKQ